MIAGKGVAKVLRKLVYGCLDNGSCTYNSFKHLHIFCLILTFTTKVVQFINHMRFACIIVKNA